MRRREGVEKMNPGARPRRTIAALAGAAAVIAGVTVLAVGGVSNEAEAEGLQRFASCAELEAWGEQSMGDQGMSRGGDDGLTIATESMDVDSSGAAEATPTLNAEGGAADGTGGDLDTGGTNVIVEGVDELDLVDRIDGEAWLVASPGRLAIVDLAGGERIASIAVGSNATVSYDPAQGLAWVVSHDPADWTLIVERVAVSADSLTVEGSWTVDGSLVAARRIGGQLHVVASDGFHGDRGPVLPFEGEPVPCDQVLHPEGPSDPSATLVATFEPEGAVEPAAVTQVVGSGQFVHLTHDAVFLATPQWENDTATTGIHRFALDGLTLTGSGEVEGSLLNEFSMSEHDGHLRVAVTHGGGGFFVGPVDVGVAVDVAVDVAEPGGAGGDDPVSSDQEPMPLPEPIEPGPGGPEPEPIPEPIEPPIPPVEPPGDPGPESVLNEIVVLDTQGDLDVVGRTDRFGKPYETIHGIRFVGPVAYAVTFLTTDPFYVVDLADPASPTVIGEVELPGFSSYLHPIGEDHVVGFGPDERGQASAKLFDVADPTAPSVVDSITLGSESAVAHDHHAFVSLGDTRFAVPVVDYRINAQTGGSTVAAAVTLEVVDGRLVEVERQETASSDWVQRIIPSEAGWAFLDGGRLVLLDPAGADRGTIPLTD